MKYRAIGHLLGRPDHCDDKTANTEAIATEIDVSQRFTLQQNSCKSLCPSRYDSMSTGAGDSSLL